MPRGSVGDGSFYALLAKPHLHSCPVDIILEHDVYVCLCNTRGELAVHVTRANNKGENPGTKAIHIPALNTQDPSEQDNSYM